MSGPWGPRGDTERAPRDMTQAELEESDWLRSETYERPAWGIVLALATVILAILAIIIRSLF